MRGDKIDAGDDAGRVRHQQRAGETRAAAEVQNAIKPRRMSLAESRPAAGRRRIAEHARELLIELLRELVEMRGNISVQAPAR